MGIFTGGLGSQLGWAAETTYGTIVTPNRFADYLPGETMSRNQQSLNPNGLAAGRMFPSSSRTVATTRDATGAISLEIPNQGFGSLINLLHGETVTPVKIGATSVYKQVHNIGTTDPFSKSITLQIGKPTIEGVVNPFTYQGTVITGMDLAIAVDGYAIASLTCDSQDETTATALATFSPPAGVQSFNFEQALVKVNGVEQKLVHSAGIKFGTPKDVGRRYLGQPLKSQPLSNAFSNCMVELGLDYKDQTLLKLFQEFKAVPVEIALLGETVEATQTELKFVMEVGRLEGDSPNVANMGALQQAIKLKVEDDRVHPPVVITYVSKDSAL